MDNLQNSEKAWARYYAVNAQWVTAWLRYVQAEDKSTAVHPGPVDNQSIMNKMIEMETTSNKNQQTFYNVNKHLFYFFYSLYGGGPAIITNETF